MMAASELSPQGLQGPFRPTSEHNVAVTTEFDPDHKSYVRHVESSESARNKVSKLTYIQSLTQLSSTLSASSSLSGSTQDPQIYDDYEETPKESDRSSIISSSSIDTLSETSESLSPLLEEITLNFNNSYVATSPRDINAFTSSSSTSSTSNTYEIPVQTRFKHYHKPKITESPRLVYLCEKFIATRNATGLALIARRRGLPPKLRQYAWPLLLESHPYVKTLEWAEPSAKESGPLKHITKEMERYQKHLALMSRHYSVKKYGDKTIEGFNKSTESQVKLDPKELETLRYKAIEEALTRFLEKWGHIFPYKKEIVYMAFCLADWVDPVCRLEDMGRSYTDGSTRDSAMSTCTSQDTIDIGDSESSPESIHVPDQHIPFLGPNGGERQLLNPDTSRHSENSVSPSETIMGVNDPEPSPFSLESHSSTLPYSFSQVFEHLMLILYHPSTASLSSLDHSSPASSATPNHVSFFLSVFHQLLPDLARHFDEEDVLVSSSSIFGGDKWLIWWIEWLGVKVWNRHDRSRIWDIYLGWRPNITMNEDHDDYIKSELISDTGLFLDLDQLDLELCPDPFSLIDLELCNENGISSTSSPLTEHMFVCLALLKSKAPTLLELDQSEIRGALSRLGKSQDIESIIIEAGKCWRTWLDSEDLKFSN